MYVSTAEIGSFGGGGKRTEPGQRYHRPRRELQAGGVTLKSALSGEKRRMTDLGCKLLESNRSCCEWPGGPG